MPPIKVFCQNPDCDASYTMTGEAVGHKVRCKKCGTAFVVCENAPPTRVRPAEPYPLPDPDALDIPTPFGKYRVLKKIGQGGMGAVYLAYDNNLDRHVALKVPSLTDGGADAEILERFKREAKAAASLNHPNFCPIYEADKVGNRPYLAMAYIEGSTMASLVSRERPMNPREAAKLVQTVALAMAVAHEKGIIHRDLKPSNVMLGRDGEPIIMDFGLARRAGVDEAEPLTVSGAMMGTVQYMPPEQLKGDRAAMGPASDIYSLGVILYELIAGCRPFEGPPHVLFAAILLNEPPSASSHRPGLDPRLDAICARAMSKATGSRYKSMRAFAGALGNVLETARSRPINPPSFPVIDKSKPPVSRTDTSEERSILALDGASRAKMPFPELDTSDESDPDLQIPRTGTSIVRWLLYGVMVGLVAIVPGVVIYTAMNREEEERPAAVVMEPESLLKSNPETPPSTKPPDWSIGDDRNKKQEADKFVKLRASDAATLEAARAAARFVGTSAGDSKTVKVGEVELVLCWSPPGRFMMGSPNTEANRFDNEGPVEVRLTTGFWAMRTEVTQDLFEAVMGKDANPSKFKGGKLPVETVSHTEAVECGAKLTQRLRESRSLPAGWEFRLPTEAEWEYAARAGTATATPFGDRLDSRKANFDGSQPYGGADKWHFLQKTAAVGSHAANAWGLLDTVGNVSEWTLDGYETNLRGGDDPFVAVAGASGQAVRGGNWFSGGRYCRSASRNRNSPSYRGRDLGFRLVAVQSVP